MREIIIPIEKIMKWINNPIAKTYCIPVKVSWPELQLTESQMIANSIARANRENDVFSDNSIFCVNITREEPK